MINHIPRLRALRQLERAAIAELSEYTKEGREQVIGAWRELAGLGRWARGTVESVLWGDEDDQEGIQNTGNPNFVVAESFQDVHNFFAAAGLA